MLAPHLLVLPAIVSTAFACQPAEPFAALVGAEHLPVLQAELGLTAVDATLADLSLLEINAIRAAIRRQPLAVSLLAARSAVADLGRQLAAARESTEAVTSGQAAEEQRLCNELAAAQQTIVTVRGQLMAAVREAVPSANWAGLDRVRSAPSTLPAPMRVLEWSQADLTALAAALAEERKSRGELALLTQADRDRILAARADAAVVAATQRLTERLPEIGRGLRGVAN